MSRTLTAGILLVAAFMPWQAVAAMHWEPAPKKASHGGHDRHAGKTYVLVDGEVSSATLVDPYLESKVLPVHQQQVVVQPVGINGYFALVANVEQKGLSESAVRYVYLNGKPAGRSPSDLMALEKAPLEIEPAPYAREHWRYLSGTKAEFILRFQGKALPLADVKLSTSNGTSEVVKSDAFGRVTILIPEDFENIQEGRRANKAAELLLIAEYAAVNQTYKTTFSVDYHVNPKHWQSNLWAILVVFIGMLLGFIIIKRKFKGKV